VCVVCIFVCGVCVCVGCVVCMEYVSVWCGDLCVGVGVWV